MPFDCLEKDAQIGGNWHQGVYHGVHVISSKTTTQYGDYPIPDWYPTFPSARLILDYLNSYAKHFRLFEHIHFNTEVRARDLSLSLPLASISLWLFQSLVLVNTQARYTHIHRCHVIAIIGLVSWIFVGFCVSVEGAVINVERHRGSAMVVIAGSSCDSLDSLHMLPSSHPYLCFILPRFWSSVVAV